MISKQNYKRCIWENGNYFLFQRMQEHQFWHVHTNWIMIKKKCSIYFVPRCLIILFYNKNSIKKHVQAQYRYISPVKSSVVVPRNQNLFITWSSHHKLLFNLGYFFVTEALQNPINVQYIMRDYITTRLYLATSH